MFSFDIPDATIKQRLMKVNEIPITGTKYSEETLTKRLEEYRKANTDDLTVLNYFDELEITPVILQLIKSRFFIVLPFNVAFLI